MIFHTVVIALLSISFNVSIFSNNTWSQEQEKELDQLVQELEIAIDAYVRSLTPGQRAEFERDVAEVESMTPQQKIELIYKLYPSQKVTGWRSWFSLDAWRDWYKNTWNR